jgi:holin-like protein
MVRSAAIVLSITIFCDLLASLLHVPVSGAAFGLIGLTGLFLWQGNADAGVSTLYDWVSPHFPLFFIPAAAGLIVSGDTLANAWVEALFAVAVSTTITIAVTGMIAQALFRAISKAKLA